MNSDMVPSRKQRIAVLTTTRAEYYQLRSTLRAIQGSSELELRLLVSGMHLSPRFGQSERDIAADGFAYERLPIPVEDDSPLGCVSAAAGSVGAVGEVLQRMEADLLLVLGDRFEVLAAAVGATCAGVPIAHIHGGETTEGAMDEFCRHAITKLSSLHFVTTDVYRERVIQLGEAAERVFNTGAPFLDEILSTKLAGEDELGGLLGIRLVRPVALVAFHPATREAIDPGDVCRTLLEQAGRRFGTLIITGPNNDPGHQKVLDAIRGYVGGRRSSPCPRMTEGGACSAPTEVVFKENLGGRYYLSAMACADVLLGNSSSGIHEAASFCRPVVNVGRRQGGRLRPRNVIDCGNDAASIASAIETALSDGFRRSLAGLVNPYGDGRAGERIVRQIEAHVPLRSGLLTKRFNDGDAVRRAIERWTR